MSDPALGLAMLGLIVIAIMMGFPTAFTLMGLGMFFGYVAFFDPGAAWSDNRVFDLMVQRTYGVMTNDTLLSIPLFVFMGYIIERAALVDKMFYSIELAFRRVPGSLAVATLIVCTFWGIASGIVGAVVVLMGVIAMKPMLKAGYDVRLASGVITAGGTLGILIPPSVMIIVYAAVAGMSVVKLYAAAIFPGFFLALLYLVYIVGWSLINPKVAPKLNEAEFAVPVPDWMRGVQTRYSRNLALAVVKALIDPSRVTGSAVPLRERIGYLGLVRHFLACLFPLVSLASIMGVLWWYVMIHQVATAPVTRPASVAQAHASEEPQELSGLALPQLPERDASDEPRELGGLPALRAGGSARDEPQELGTGRSAGESSAATQLESAPPDTSGFVGYFWIACAGLAMFLGWYYWRMDAEQFQILEMLLESVMPLSLLTLAVLAVILFGITTATESAAVGAAGALVLAAVDRQLSFDRLKESVFLTAKTTAMVCWLFVGSALFSAVFAVHGGQQLIEQWVLGLNLSPIEFMLLSQAIIFLLGWPLEWTEIIVIFVPIFLPLLQHFDINPILFATLVAVNLQAAFLSPPVAMSAFYLKGVAPSHVTLNQIFAGMMPYMIIIVLCMVIMYVWPELTLWLPNYLYR